MEYTKNEVEILKRVIKDYEIINKDIRDRIEKGYTFENLCDYIRHLSSCSITNYQENEYIDFNYCDMCISIYKDDLLGAYLGASIEVWNDKENYHINTFSDIREIKRIVEVL